MSPSLAIPFPPSLLFPLPCSCHSLHIFPFPLLASSSFPSFHLPKERARGRARERAKERARGGGRERGRGREIRARCGHLSNGASARERARAAPGSDFSSSRAAAGNGDGVGKSGADAATFRAGAPVNKTTPPTDGRKSRGKGSENPGCHGRRFRSPKVPSQHLCERCFVEDEAEVAFDEAQHRAHVRTAWPFQRLFLMSGRRGTGPQAIASLLLFSKSAWSPAAAAMTDLNLRVRHSNLGPAEHMLPWPLLSQATAQGQFQGRAMFRLRNHHHQHARSAFGCFRALEARVHSGSFARFSLFDCWRSGLQWS